MHFVSPKSEAQQALSVLHRLRDSLVGDLTKTANQMHGFLFEFAVSLPRGLVIMKHLSVRLTENQLPTRLIALLDRLREHFNYLDAQINDLDKDLACHWLTMILVVVY